MDNDIIDETYVGNEYADACASTKHAEKKFLVSK